MTITISNGPRTGCVTVPASKSWAHRMLITAALSGKSCEITCDGISNDISATVKCLNAMGARIDFKENEDRTTVISVKPIIKTEDRYGQMTLHSHLFCGESGSTLRFLIPVVGALGINAAFHMEGRLSERPLEPLTKVLEEHGMSFRKDGQILYCMGQLKGGIFEIPGNISSQYISGLLMALPVLDESSTVIVTGSVESGDYIEMTVRAIEEAGVSFDRQGYTFKLTESRKYNIPERLTVEKDWSSAAFPLCMGAFSDEGITVTGLNLDSVQGDKEIVNILKGFGAEVIIGDINTGIEITADKDVIKEHSDNNLVAVTVKKGNLKGQVIDASRIPDLVPVISAVAAGAEGETRIIHAERLRLKESDRLETTASMLKAIGADIEVTEDGLLINGNFNGIKEKFSGKANAEESKFSSGARLSGGIVDSFNDHRIAMSAAVAAGICTGPVTVNGTECTDKSFPGFWDMLDGLSCHFPVVSI